MKFTKFSSFNRHLLASLPDHSSFCYGILVKNEGECEYLTQDLIYRHLGERDVRFFLSKTCPVPTFLQEISSLTFFSQKRILVYRGIDQLPKKEILELSHALSKSPFLEQHGSDLTVILTAQQKGAFDALYPILKKEIVSLDLGGEPVWEKKQRWSNWLFDLAKREGKILSLALAKKWVDRCNESWTFLRFELEKWIAFSGEKRELEELFFEQIGCAREGQISWKLTEALLEKRGIADLPSDLIYLEDWARLLPLFRYHLKTALTFACAKGKEEGHYSQRQVRFYRSLIHLWRVDKLVEGLSLLADCELCARKGLDPKLAVSKFLLQFYGEE